MGGMVKIGMIGYNEGNGHPYSFSAIINGYDPHMMAKSPYPVIANYLSKRLPEEFGIRDFNITHIWSPDAKISQNIAECTFIPNVVSEYKNIKNEVDAIIIARDDVESHYEIANYFLNQGLPVLVDKPLCDRIEHLDHFLPYIENGQLMSCSGLRYQPEIVSLFDGKLDKEEICFVNTLTVLDWKKYGIHVLEAITPIMGNKIKKVSNLNDSRNRIVKIEYQSGQYALIQINDQCMNPIQASFYTKDKMYNTIFNQNFVCFKTMLSEFGRMITEKIIPIDPIETYQIVKTIIEGE